MNYSTVVFLINHDVRAVLATYEKDEETSGKSAPREMFKTLDKTIATGDYVVVPTGTRHRMTVCKIVATDVDVDFDSDTPVKWIVSKIDSGEHDRLLRMEDQAVQAVKHNEARKKRASLMEAFAFGDMADIKALPISTIDQASPSTEESKRR